MCFYIYKPLTGIYHIHPNRSIECKLKALGQLGAHIIISVSQPILTAQRYLLVYTHLYVCTYVDKAEAICEYVEAKWTLVSLGFYSFLTIFQHFIIIWHLACLPVVSICPFDGVICLLLKGEGVSIGYCAYIRMDTVHVPSEF